MKKNKHLKKSSNLNVKRINDKPKERHIAIKMSMGGEINLKTNINNKNKKHYKRHNKHKSMNFD